MALSKNFTLPEKCKNYYRALREILYLSDSFFKLCGSSLFNLETAIPCSWTHIAIGTSNQAECQSLYNTFKFALMKEENKNKQKTETFCNRLFFMTVNFFPLYECSYAFTLTSQYS